MMAPVPMRSVKKGTNCGAWLPSALTKALWCTRMQTNGRPDTTTLMMSYSTSSSRMAATKRLRWMARSLHVPSRVWTMQLPRIVIGLKMMAARALTGALRTGKNSTPMVMDSIGPEVLGPTGTSQLIIIIGVSLKTPLYQNRISSTSTPEYQDRKSTSMTSSKAAIKSTRSQSRTISTAPTSRSEVILNVACTGTRSSSWETRETQQALTKGDKRSQLTWRSSTSTLSSTRSSKISDSLRSPESP